MQYRWLESRAVAVRKLRVVPLVAELATWMGNERRRLSRHSEVAKAMDYPDITRDGAALVARPGVKPLLSKLGKSHRCFPPAPR